MARAASPPILIAEELANSERRILTNLAVEKLPWVTADHQPRRGLLDYLLEKHGKTFNAEERIFRVTDDAIPNFYLYRGLSRKQVEEMGEKYLQGFRLVTPEDEVLVPSEWNSHKDIQLYVADHQFHLDKRGKKVVDEHDTRLASFSRGSVNIIDEAWKFWPARGWSSTSESVNFHFAQVGKFTDDTWVVTHRVNDVDALLIDRCQDFYVCTNHGKLTFGLFRQPAMFSVAVYATKPTPSAEPQSRKVFTLDKHGLADAPRSMGAGWPPSPSPIMARAASSRSRFRKPSWLASIRLRPIPAPLYADRSSFCWLVRAKESILRSFGLSVIGRYFPEYEREIRRTAS